MVQKRLFRYILKYRKQGYSENQLKSRLSKDGWNSKEIDNAFILVRKNLNKKNKNKVNQGKDVKKEVKGDKKEKKSFLDKINIFKRKFKKKNIESDKNNIKSKKKNTKNDKKNINKKNNQESNSSSKSLIKKRNPFLVLLFSLISLGIYFIYWIISTNLELEENTDSAPSLYLLLLIFLFNVVSFSFIFYGFFFLKGFFLDFFSFFYIALFVLCLISIILMIIYFYKYSKALNKLTGFNKIVLTLLWIILWPVAQVISQIQLNKKT